MLSSHSFFSTCCCEKIVENFNIEKSSQEILVLLETFQKQWNMFTKQFSAVDKKIIDLKLDLISWGKNQAIRLNYKKSQ